MSQLTLIYGEQIRTVEVKPGDLLGDAVAASGLPLEQPCAGRGTCGKCKVLAEMGVAPPDEIELEHLTPGELALNNRLACRARIEGDSRVILAPIVVYSNKIFRSSSRYKRTKTPLGLAIDLGSTTVAAYLTMLDDGEVQAGAASLNQQTVFGADVISRMAAALDSPQTSDRLRRLALASINQAVDSLKLSDRIRQRIERVVIVCNVAMHHLLTGMPLDSLAYVPFQPYKRSSLTDATGMMDGIFTDRVRVSLPPLIGGFVGSDALACLAYFDFDKAKAPMAAVDLGTNGEVMVTDGKRILTASTAAGPAFEGVNISCGTRAVDGAITKARLGADGFEFDTIAGEPPIGLTGSGLLSLIHVLRSAGVIDPGGRMLEDSTAVVGKFGVDPHGARSIYLTPDKKLHLSQLDVRELQKAKGAIRAAIDILLERLDLQPRDLERFILTGSFGGQLDIEAVLTSGMLPPVPEKSIQTIPNGAGFGAALFLNDEGFERAERIAAYAEQIDLDKDPEFDMRYLKALRLDPDLTSTSN
jgi:uncharacterized 2Fe-2S/4Fe-4S cluster protein (DUF4445 family)